MLGRMQTIAVLTCLFPVLSAAWSEEKKPQEIKNWGTVVNPASDCKVTQKEGMVTIVVPGTHHDLNPTPRFNNLLAPRVLREVEGDFVVQVKVIPFPIPAAKTASSKAGISFVGAGLLVWQDEKNFLRLMRAGNGESDSSFSSVELFRDGEFAGSGLTTKINREKESYLRITRAGNTFTLAVSADNKEWTVIRPNRMLNLKNVELTAKLRVGIIAVNATDKEFAPRFEELSVEKKDKK
jgi:regulation of enolase protein 1 (concanavalin A-like superfamily)